jgi:hypothetical protein
MLIIDTGDIDNIRYNQGSRDKVSNIIRAINQNRLFPKQAVYFLLFDQIYSLLFSSISAEKYIHQRLAEIIEERIGAVIDSFVVQPDLAFVPYYVAFDPAFVPFTVANDPADHNSNLAIFD